MRALRWVALLVACLMIAASGFGAGLGTVALFSDTETISGSFSVADEPEDPFGPGSGNGTANDGGAGGENGSDGGTLGNGTAAPNGTDVGNDTTGANRTVSNGTVIGNGTTPNGSVGGNDGAGGNSTGDSAVGDGNRTDDPGGADVGITAVELSASEVAVGETAGVLVTVQNDGSVSASFTATLTVDGSETTSGTIGLEPGEQSTLSLSHPFQSSGNYTLRAAGVVAGTVEVVESAGNATASNG